MELDELKSAWQALDRRLADTHALNLHVYQERRVDDARARLRPLSWGQRVQIPLGLVTIAVAAIFWIAHLHQAGLLVSGIAVQAYGIALVVHAARVLTLIRQIDQAAPVVAVQRQMAELRRAYASGNWQLGLAWWFLWIPLFLMLIAVVSGVDLSVRAPSFVWISVAIGVAGLVASWRLHRWAHRPGQAGFGAAFVDSLAGRSIVRAQAIIDDLARFEQK
ncbi:MAG: serine/threonine protein kinase [Vicinamibacterales bacterium]